jgi:hypothetical protein
MAAKTQLEILGKKLEEAELLLVTMEDAKVLPPDMLLDYFNTRLVPLLHKDIPPEVCSDVKLSERIEEVEALINDVKFEIARING